MQQLGAKKKPPFYGDSVYLLPDSFLQMCIPLVEYPRRDAPPTPYFAGGRRKGYRDPLMNAPSWWTEITSNTTKKIVAVSQGSLALNYEDLLIPTLKGLKDRRDVLIVAALGKKGATLPEASTYRRTLASSTSTPSTACCHTAPRSSPTGATGPSSTPSATERRWSLGAPLRTSLGWRHAPSGLASASICARDRPALSR
jgi:hypothetical protein